MQSTDRRHRAEDRADQGEAEVTSLRRRLLQHPGGFERFGLRHAVAGRWFKSSRPDCAKASAHADCRNLGGTETIFLPRWAVTSLTNGRGLRSGYRLTSLMLLLLVSEVPPSGV